MWKLLSRLVGGNVRGQLSVLFFHRVLAEPDAMLSDEPTADSFGKMVGWLCSQYNLLPLDEAVRRMRTGTLPPCAAAISFDDGYRDNFTVAAPLLKRMGVPAAFFISTGFLDGGIMWNDRVTEAVRLSPLSQLPLDGLNLGTLELGQLRRRGKVAGRILNALKYMPQQHRDAAVQRVVDTCGCKLPTDVMMTSQELRGLANMGFVIGAHTVSHPILESLSDDSAKTEIAQGRATLEQLLGRRVGLFAYPNGRAGKDFGQRHRNMVQACGYDAAFTTEPGVCDAEGDAWALPRFTPWDRTELKFRLRMLANQRRSALPANSGVGMASAGN